MSLAKMLEDFSMEAAVLSLTLKATRVIVIKEKLTHPFLPGLSGPVFLGCNETGFEHQHAGLQSPRTTGL